MMMGHAPLALRYSHLMRLRHLRPQRRDKGVRLWTVNLHRKSTVA
jgi:hypothetical protein